ncbi:MAG: porin family protein [Bacteroidales bacterium]|nr:porin family protein [Bacteroidales bacterium]
MKQIIISGIAWMIMFPLLGQEIDTVPDLSKDPLAAEAPAVEEEPALEENAEAPQEENTVRVTGKVKVIETPDKSRATLGENEVFIVEENGDTMKVILGSRGISIVEGEEGTEIKVIEMDDPPQKSNQKKKKRFRPHFSGLEVGLNNFVTPDYSLTLPPEERYMDVNTGKSWNWNVNIIDYGFGLGTDKVGVVSGLGFEFINYSFDGQNSIRKDPVTSEIMAYVPDYAGNISKSKMNITYLTAPLLLEFQIPAPRKRIYFSAGLIGGLKLWSNTKMKYTISGEKSKEKVKGDYNLSPLRWGVTARAGYKALGFYATYYMTPLFEADLGPELYPFNIGLAFSF